MNRRAVLAIVLLLSLLAAACGSRNDDNVTANSDPPPTTAPTGDPSTTLDPTGTTAQATSTEPSADPCDGATLEATDTGVTADTITVVVMADVDSPLAPGLFQGSVDGVNAWADHVNSEGGLACRQVDVIFHDSKLNPTETTNGFLAACESALAMVGTTVLFATDVNDLNNCPDGAGNAIGVPDLSYITTEAPHQCSANSFHISRPGASCPYEGGDRDYVAATGAVNWLVQNVAGGAANGIYIVPSDLPSTIASAVPQLAAQETVGVTYDAAFNTSGRATQAEFGQYVQNMRDNSANWVYNGSNDQAMLKLRSEAADQGLDSDSVTWVCSLSCYTPSFIEQGGAAVENTYVWMTFVPFQEADTNAELGDFMASINDPFPAAWSAGAWADGVLLEQIVADIVAADGPNGVTRQSVLDAAKATTSFDANAWWGEVDLTDSNNTSPCFAILQVQGGEYVRVHPTEPGTLDCSDTNTVAVTANPDEFVPDN